jgi:hypothetical protein
VTATPSPWRLGVELVRLALVCSGLSLLLYGGHSVPVVHGGSQTIATGGVDIDSAPAQSGSAVINARNADVRAFAPPREAALVLAAVESDSTPGDNDDDDDDSLGDELVVVGRSQPVKGVNDEAAWRITAVGIDLSSFFASDNHSLRAPPK